MNAFAFRAFAALLFLISSGAALAGEAGRPFAYFILSSDSFPAAEIQEIAESTVVPILKKIEGIEEVTVVGARRPALRIRFDPQRLEAYGLSMKDAEVGLAPFKLGLQSRVNSLFEREMIAASTRDFPPLQELGTIALKSVNGAPIRLNDVATIEIRLEGELATATYRDKKVLACGVSKQSGANALGLLVPLYLAWRQMKMALSVGVELVMVPPSSLRIDKNP